MQNLGLFFDLPTLSGKRFLQPYLNTAKGKVLDIQARHNDWKILFNSSLSYVGLNLQRATFEIPQRSEPLPFDGQKFPFLDGNFDLILCTQALEQVENPVPLLKEIHRSLSADGTLLIICISPTAPNRRPEDSVRVTKSSLALLLEKNHFEVLKIQTLGNNFARTANQLVQMSVRTKLLGLFYLPFTLVLLGLAHLSSCFNFGGQTDPLGFSLVAKKSSQRQFGI